MKKQWRIAEQKSCSWHIRALSNFFLTPFCCQEPPMKGKGIQSNNPTGFRLPLQEYIKKYTRVLNSPFSWKDLKLGVYSSQAPPLLTSQMSLECHETILESAPVHI